MKDQFSWMKKHFKSHIDKINSDTRFDNFQRIKLFEESVKNVINYILGTELTMEQKDNFCRIVEQILEKQKKFWSS